MIISPGLIDIFGLAFGSDLISELNWEKKSSFHQIKMMRQMGGGFGLVSGGKVDASPRKVIFFAQ